MAVYELGYDVLRKAGRIGVERSLVGLVQDFWRAGVTSGEAARAQVPRVRVVRPVEIRILMCARRNDRCTWRRRGGRRPLFRMASYPAQNSILGP